MASGAKIIALIALTVAATAGVWTYYQHYTEAAKMAALQREKAELESIVERLSAERRVAEMLVREQHRDQSGVLVSTILFVEYVGEDKSLPPRMFTVRGEHVHVDAKVIQFELALVKAGDLLKGKSIGLFTRIYGDAQTPEEAEQIDRKGDIPQPYRGDDPVVSPLELELWGQFWRLAEDAALRQQAGVRLAQGEGVWFPPKLNMLYTLSLENDGGLNVRIAPLKGIYQEALKPR